MERVFVLILADRIHLRIGRPPRIVVLWPLGRQSTQQFAATPEKKESNRGPGCMNIVFSEGRQHRGYRAAHADQVLAILLHRLEIANSPVQFKIQGNDERARGSSADRQL